MELDIVDNKMNWSKVGCAWMIGEVVSCVSILFEKIKFWCDGDSFLGIPGAEQFYYRT